MSFLQHAMQNAADRTNGCDEKEVYRCRKRESDDKGPLMHERHECPSACASPGANHSSAAEKNGEFVRVSWEEALQFIKEQVVSIQQEDGHDAVGVYGSASITNEEAYLLGKFARVALKTRHIDYNGRLCMSAAATAANQTFGMDRGFTNALSEVPPCQGDHACGIEYR